MKTPKNCIGPCLPHCASDQRVIYLVIGFILGILCYIFIDKIILKDSNKSENNYKVNNNKVNGNKVNDNKLNDNKLNYNKVNDNKVNKNKLNFKANNYEPT